MTITTSSSVCVSVARSPQEVDNGKDDGHRLVDGIKEPDGGLGVVIVPSVGYLVIQLNSGVKTLKRKDLCGGKDANHLLGDGIEQAVGVVVILLQDGGHCLLMQEKLGNLN